MACHVATPWPHGVANLDVIEGGAQEADAARLRSLVVAAVGRLPGVLPLGPAVFFGLAFLVVLAGIIYDRVSRARVHPVYLWGGAVLAISVPLRLFISRTEAWTQFAQFVGVTSSEPTSDLFAPTPSQSLP